MEFILLILVVILLSSVTGIQFQLSQNNINLANPQSNFVNLTCSMTVTSAQLVTIMKLRKESNSGSSWDQIAAIVVSQNASFSSSLSNDFRSIMQVSGRLVNNPATDSKLVVSMNASLITCLHTRKYRCELSYFDDDVTQINEAKNITLQATASPSTPYIETVKNLNTNQVVNVAQGALSIQVDEQLEIVCKADLGTNQNTMIQWDYNSASGSGMIGYNGYKVNSEPVVDTSGGAATSCRYTRTSTMRYNISDIDFARSSSNPLIFSCYIQSGGITTQNNPMYTVTISGRNSGNTVSTGNTENTEGTGNTDNTGNTTTIVLSVLGFILAVIVVNILIWFCVWNRRQKRRKEKSAPKELVPVEQRRNRLTYQQSDIDEEQNYTNLYATIPDTYMDCASATEERNVEEECHTIIDKDGKSHNSVSDADGITVTKREDGYLSFNRRETETPYYENQIFNSGTGPVQLNTKGASMVDSNSTDYYLTPISGNTHSNINNKQLKY